MQAVLVPDEIHAEVKLAALRDKKTIQEFVADALRAVGLSGADAGKVAELMTEADLTG